MRGFVDAVFLRGNLVYENGYFIKKICSKYGFAPKRITPQAVAILESYDWLGNVRELENYIESIIALMPSKKEVINSNDVEDIRRREDRGFLEREIQAWQNIPEKLYNLSL